MFTYVRYGAIAALWMLYSASALADSSAPQSSDSSIPPQTSTSAVLTLAEAKRQAAFNPALASRKSRAAAMGEIPLQLSTLPDPMLSLNAVSLPTDGFSTTQEGMTQLQLGIRQALPYPGKLALRAETATAMATAASFDVKETALIIIRNVQLTWWNLYFLDRAISIVQRNQVLLRQFVRIANTKYKTGQGLQSDVLLAQLELSKLLDVEISLKSARRDQAASINALMNRPATASVLLPVQMGEVLPIAPEAMALLQQAKTIRPMLAAQRSTVEAARSRISLAEKDYYPDFSVGAVYGYRSGNNPNGSARADLSSIMFSMNLPIFTDSKQDRALAQREAELSKEQFTLEDHILQVDADITRALSDYRAAYEQSLLFKTGIIPQANQTVASMLASYQVNKVDFLNLVRAQITSYNYETQYWKAISQAKQAWARLEAAVGHSIADKGSQP